MYPFSISQQCEKRLFELQQRKYSYRKRIHHQSCPKHTVACAATCELAGENDPVGPSVAKDNWSHHCIRFHALEQLCLHMQTICLWQNKQWLVYFLFFLYSMEVEVMSCVRQQVWLEFGCELADCGLGIRADPRHELAAAKQNKSHPAFFSSQYTDSRLDLEQLF